jgi:hypothetical protein
MKLAFGILCAREDPATIAQLVDSLGPDALVLIHHDVSKRPTPDLRGRPNVRFVRDPVITGWGEWSLCAAILRLLRDGLAEPRWDYFQLLSGSCLPIKRVDAFERFLEASRADANVDMVALDEDPVALMSHGFRAFAPADSLRHRALRRLRRWYLGDRPRWVNRQGLGFALPADDPPPATRARLALGAMRLVSAGGAPGFAHPFGDRMRCFVGSTWWGANRAACQHLASQPEDDPLQRYFRRLRIPDEFYFQTVLGNSGLALGESNHVISRFDEAHPMRMDTDALPMLAASPRFFARKFPDDPTAAVRLALLGRLGAPAAAQTRPVRARRAA